MNRLFAWFAERREIGPLFIRLLIGFHLIYGVQDNILSYPRMLEFRDFLLAQGFPLPLISAFVSVYAQFVAGTLFILGWKTRPASALMVVNFLVALLAVHVGDSYSNSFPALVMLSGSLFLLYHGPGRLALDGE